LNKPIETLLPEHARESHVRQRDHYMADPLTRPMGFVDLAARRRDGTEIPVDISLTAIETEDGRLAIAFVRDITARHDAELAIKQLAAIVESSDDAIIGKTLDGTILTWNLGAERMYGYSAAEMVGRPVSVLAPPDLPDELPDLIGRLQRGEEIDQLETKRRRRDGAEIDVLLKVSAIRNGRGEIVGSSSIARDITQLKAQADLERDLAERRALLAHLVTAGEEERARIAGDIHDDSIQAITAAGMRLQILRRKVDDPEQLKLLGELEETIRLSIDRLRHLLFDLRPPILDTEGLAAAVEMYLEDAANGATTRYELEDKLRSQPSAQTRTILYRIVQEALMNVRKHAVAATATVLLQERDGGYLVRIADDGVGFAVDQAKPVLGHLGLASMRERAMLADGWMRVRSAPQDGTTIEVWVPALGPADDESNALASASNGTPTARVAR
jgi:PAS domain S-box-containing protein